MGYHETLNTPELGPLGLCFFMHNVYDLLIKNHVKRHKLEALILVKMPKALRDILVGFLIMNYSSIQVASGVAR